jgi:nicotinate-nucleotide pyrophosphorylase (carboxylating)
VTDQRRSRIEPYGDCTPGELFEHLVSPTLDPAIDRWLAEDFGEEGDLTTSAFISPDVEVRAELRSRQHGVLCGLPIVRRIASRSAGTIESEPLAVDGDRVEPGMRVMELRGPLAAILPVERTLLNLLGRASGVATMTARFVDAVAGTNAVIVDTRKTTPGLRMIEKYAVRTGGGTLHRIGLYDAVLVKDNHIAGLGDGYVDAIEAAAMACREQMRPRFIEIEVDRLEQFDAILELPSGIIDIVLLDNMELATMREAVEARDRRRRGLLLEASGSITIDSVRAIAETGVDRIAVGAITHSAVQIDFGLDIE